MSASSAGLLRIASSTSRSARLRRLCSTSAACPLRAKSRRSSGLMSSVVRRFASDAGFFCAISSPPYKRGRPPRCEGRPVIMCLVLPA
nr:MAG TPA: hypothetical protein [Ackermannviridae sp.]